MAIITLDEVIAGLQQPQSFLKLSNTIEAAGVMASLFYSSGRPGAGVAPSPGLAGEALTSLSGQIPWSNPGSGNSYLARFAAGATQQGRLLLLDRLWQNSGITSTTTTGQTVDSVTFPARDRNGSTNGEDVLVGIEVSTATSNGAPITNTTLTYTNQAGTGSRTGTISSFPATAQIGTFVPFQLQAGDTGVRSIQTLTLGTSYGTGVIHLVAYRILAVVDIPVANVGDALDAITGGFVRLYDNTVPYLVWVGSGTNSPTVTGQLIVAQG